jgi:hypothetical protein
VSDPIQPTSNGASSPSPEPKRNLRETLEAAWDTVVENAPPEPGDGGDGSDLAAPPPVDSGERPRDESGRWVKREAQPGEAAQPSQRTEHPAPPPSQQPQAAAPSPAQAGGAAQAPANWSAEDRAAFDELTDRGKAFILRRHSEMEGFVQQRVQASAQAANFAQSLAPIFTDSRIARSLQEAGVGPSEAIQQWAGFHLRFLTDPVNMIGELIQRARIDPAVFASGIPPAGQPGTPPAGLPKEAMSDPTIKFIADQFGRSNNDILALRGELQAMQRATQERQAAEVMRVTRWGIDSFAEEKDAQGQPLHPHFDAVLPHIIQLFKADPQRDLREAYETALWMDANTRSGLLQRERQTVTQQQSTQRAAQQVRSNVTGRTHPVTPPPRPEGQKRNLREALEQAADQVGLD